METFAHDGLTFDVTDVGPPDGRVVIGLHGFPEDRHCWDQIGTAVAGAGHRFLAPDQRGYSPGAQPRGRKSYVGSNLAGDILALADAAGADRFDVIGHDWGGFVAWDLAARHPDRVRSVTSLSTPHPGAVLAALTRSTQLFHSWYMLFFQLPAVPEKVFALRGGKLQEATLERVGLDHDTAERYAVRFATPGAMTGPINWYRAMPYSFRDRMPSVEVPALYVWSDGDQFLTRVAAERTASFVTGPYRFEVLPGQSHWLPTGAAQQVAPLLLDHLASVPT